MVSLFVSAHQPRAPPVSGGSSASGAPAEPGYLVGGPTSQQSSANEGTCAACCVDPPPLAQSLTRKSTNMTRGGPEGWCVCGEDRAPRKRLCCRGRTGADAQGGRGSAPAVRKGWPLIPPPGHGASLRWETYANIHMYVRWPHTGWRPAASTSRQGHTRQEALLARAAQRLKERCAAGRPPRRAPASREAERGPGGHGQASGHESQRQARSRLRTQHQGPGAGREAQQRAAARSQEEGQDEQQAI